MSQKHLQWSAVKKAADRPIQAQTNWWPTLWHTRHPTWLPLNYSWSLSMGFVSGMPEEESSTSPPKETENLEEKPAQPILHP